MTFFLTIREGTGAEDNYPIFATADPEIIQLVVRGLTRRLRIADVRPILAIKKQSLGTDQTTTNNTRDQATSSSGPIDSE
jgi:hypothetical protein